MIENSNLLLYVYEPVGVWYEMKSIIERPVYVEYNALFGSKSSFRVTAQRTEQNTKNVTRGDLIWIEQDIVGIVTYIKDSSNGTITFGGNLGETLLSQRAIFNDIVIEGQSAYEAIATVYNSLTPIIGMSLQDASSTTDKLSITAERGNFLDFVEKVCQNNGVGYTVRSDTSSTYSISQMGLKLSIISGQDRSDDVIISQNFGTLQDFEYTVNTENEVNFVKVIGENDISVDVSTEEGASSIKVKEYVLDCTGIKQGELTQAQYEEILQAKGKEVINAHQRKETFSGSYTGKPYEFYVDFNLGDKVSVIDTDHDISTVQQIVGFFKQFDSSGIYPKLSFGQIQDTISATISKLTKKVENLENLETVEGEEPEPEPQPPVYIPQEYFQATDPALSHTINSGDKFYMTDTSSAKNLLKIMRWENGQWNLMCTIPEGGGSGSSLVVNVEHAIIAQKAGEE